MDTKHVFGWLTFDMMLFVVLNALFIWHFGDRLSYIWNIDLFHLFVLGLATYRAANIVSNEAVTKPLRSPFVDETREKNTVIEQPKKEGFLRAVGLLIYCPSCTGVWLAAALTYSYIVWPTPTFVIALFLCLSAIERILSSFIGLLKQKTQ